MHHPVDQALLWRGEQRRQDVIDELAVAERRVARSVRIGIEAHQRHRLLSQARQLVFQLPHELVGGARAVLVGEEEVKAPRQSERPEEPRALVARGVAHSAFPEAPSFLDSASASASSFMPATEGCTSIHSSSFR